MEFARPGDKQSCPEVGRGVSGIAVSANEEWGTRIGQVLLFEVL